MTLSLCACVDPWHARWAWKERAAVAVASSPLSTSCSGGTSLLG